MAEVLHFSQPGPRRDLPMNIQAEQAILGAMLCENTVYTRLAGHLLAEHFYDPINAHIYTRIAKRIDAGQIADPVSLADDLRGSGTLEEVGGTYFLARLVTAMVGIVPARSYAKVVIECWRRRQMIEVAEKLIEQCYAGQEEADAIASATQTALDQATASTGTRRGVMLSAAIEEAMRRAEAASRGDVGTVISTGFAEFDEASGGLEDGTFMVLGGRPGSGKTAFALQMAERIGCDLMAQGPDAGGILIVSLEMQSFALARRLLARRSNISTIDIKMGRLRGRGEALVLASKELHGLPILIEDAPGQNVAMIKQRARAASRRFGRLRLLIVDHMHIVAPDAADRANNTQAIGRISNALRDLSKELGCPVLGLAQLSRSLTQREDKRPVLNDLRQSGDIEQDADIVAFVHREELYLPKSEPARMPGESADKHAARVASWREARTAARGQAEIILEKCREGPSTTIRMRFDGETSTFIAGSLPDPQPSSQGILNGWSDRYFDGDPGA